MQKLLAVLVIAACSDLALGVRGRSRALRVTTGMRELAERHINDWAQQHLSKHDAVNLAGFARGLDATEAHLLDGLLRASGRQKQIPADQATEVNTVIDNMLATIDTSHTTDQQAIANAYGSFAQCANTVTAEESQVQGYQQSYNSKVTSHTTARRAEGVALNAKTECENQKAAKQAEKQRTQDAFTSALGKPACAQCDPPPESATEAAKQSWLNGQKACYREAADAAETAKLEFDAAVLDEGGHDCTTTVSTFGTKKSEADSLLQGLESDSCAAARSQNVKCASLESCHASAVQSYNKAKAQVQTQIDNRKVQWRGNTRIKCIIAAMDTNTVDAIKECLDEVLDDTHLSIVFQDAPAEPTCSPLAEYPCTGAYTTRVYLSEFDRLIMPTCNACDLNGASGGGGSQATACKAVSIADIASLSGNNVAAQAAGAIPFGSASLPGYCSTTSGGEGYHAGVSGIHCWQNINDGKLGNSYSWIPGAAGASVGVRFATSKMISGIRVSRKGEGSCCNDRTGGSYEVWYSEKPDATYDTPDASWCKVGSFTRATTGFVYQKFSEALSATAIRIVASDSGACIDELQVYEASQATTCKAVSIADIASLSGNNVAAQTAGAIPFGSASLSGYCSTTSGGEGHVASVSGIHCWQNINDGKLGNSYSWIPGAAGATVGVRFATSKVISGIRVSRKGEGSCCNDRTGGSYEIWYSEKPDATYNTPDASWCMVGSFTRATTSFVYQKFSEALSATAIRIVASDSGACIDELEVYEA